MIEVIVTMAKAMLAMKAHPRATEAKTTPTELGFSSVSLLS